MMLVVGVGILLTAYGGLLNLNPGFDRSNLLMVRLASISVGSPQSDEATIRGLLNRLRSVPGVRAATASSILPPLRGGVQRSFSSQDQAALVAASGTLADVDAAFFGAIGLKVIRGNAFDDANPAAGDQLAISEAVAHRYWPSADPIGRFVRLEGEQKLRQIVAIVGDVRRNPYTSVAIPYIYQLRREGGRETYVLVRSSHDAAELAPIVRSIVREEFPDRPLPVPVTLEAMINRQATDFLFAALIISPTILLTLVLSAAGIYGLVAQTVVARSHELGVRAALGASRRQLLGLILGDGLKLARTGAIAGVVVVVAVNRLAMSAFVGVTWASPLVVAFAAVLMAFVALAASYLPASRAARVDPMTALRHE
jgi:putative ABC transport system permease protein